MKILICHNYYQHAGGEDRAFHADVDLLRRHGHEVIEYTENNTAIHQQRGVVDLALTTVWSVRTHRLLSRLMRAARPDVAHFHNTFPLISPSAYYACRDAGVPVVQTLHNYRLVCPCATLYRDGHVCQDCVGRSFALSGILGACYRQSRTATAVVALMNTAHRMVGTWQRLVAPGLATVFLVAILIMILDNFDRLLGPEQGSALRWILPGLLLLGAIAGFVRSAVLRSRKPATYAKVGGVGEPTSLGSV